jgi:hypothetical protein
MGNFLQKESWSFAFLATSKSKPEQIVYHGIEALCTLFQVNILKIDRVMTFLDFKGFGPADAKFSNYQTNIKISYKCYL